MSAKTIEEAHNLLPEGNIRQFLSACVSADSSWDKSLQQSYVERYKAQLAELQAKVKAAEADLAILTLAEQKGWSFFDVGNYVPPVRGSANKYPPFIGTQKEHDRFVNCQQLKKYLSS